MTPEEIRYILEDTIYAIPNYTQAYIDIGNLLSDFDIKDTYINIKKKYWKFKHSNELALIKTLADIAILKMSILENEEMFNKEAINMLNANIEWFINMINKLKGE